MTYPRPLSQKLAAPLARARSKDLGPQNQLGLPGAAHKHKGVLVLGPPQMIPVLAPGDLYSLERSSVEKRWWNLRVKESAFKRLLNRVRPSLSGRTVEGRGREKRVAGQR